MNVYLIIFNIAILLLLIGVLAYMQKKYVSFSKRVFTALGLGIVFGFALQGVYGAGSAIVQQSTQWFDIVGTGYVKLLQMIVMPLVFISIVMAFTKLSISNFRENCHAHYWAIIGHYGDSRFYRHHGLIRISIRGDGNSFRRSGTDTWTGVRTKI